MRRFSSGVILLSVVSIAEAQSYIFSTFDPPGSTSTTVKGINNAGQIVGNFQDASGLHGFLRTGPTYTVIEALDAFPHQTVPGAINNLGEITGSFTNATGTHGFVRTADGRTFTVFDAPDPLGVGRPTGAYGINDLGEIVGGFSWGLADYGFLRSPQGDFTTIEIGGNTFVRSINNMGEIAGAFRIGGSGGFLQGFVRSRDGTYQTINVPGIIGTQVAGINNTGQIVGQFASSLFVRNADGTFHYAVVPGASQVFAADINDSGTIAGFYNASGVLHGFLAAPLSGDTRPLIRSERGVISAFAFGGYDAIAPGSWIELYGQNLAKTTRQWKTADFNGSTAPTALEGVSVRIGGQLAFISYISPGQINAQVPSTVAPGMAQVAVFSDGQVSAAYAIQVRALQPGVLAFPQTDLYSRTVVALLPDNVTYALPPNSNWPVPSRLARAGDTLTMYGIGFGPVTPAVPGGRIASQTSSLTTSLRILFNDVPATINYAGLAPGSVGLYQFNVIVPHGAARSTNRAQVVFAYDGGTRVVDRLFIGLAP